MPRYFLEVAYKGTAYSGFQSQKNANTIQAEIEKGIQVLLKKIITLTGSSRTDTGVHASQNFFHFDSDIPINQYKAIECESNFVYKLNAILPGDIVAKSCKQVSDNAHCRFDAISREYKYYIYNIKDPFLNDRAFYFPYKLDIDLMVQASQIIMEYSDFTSFSKRKTQVKNFDCQIKKSIWVQESSCLVFNVKANRFLRGMVRALTATMLKVGRGKVTLDEFRRIIEAKNCSKASFAVPAHGLFLQNVEYKGI